MMRESDQSAVITWTTNSNGRSVAHYGVNAQDWTETAESPNRRNPNLPYMGTTCWCSSKDALAPQVHFWFCAQTKGPDSEGSIAGVAKEERWPDRPTTIQDRSFCADFVS